MFTPEQIRKYAAHVFADQRITDRTEQRFKCPIHDGRDRNFAFNLDRGVWTCHSQCGSGGMVQLEHRLRGGSREDATERLFKLVGMAPEYQGKQLVCSYDYTDASGRLLFQKVRLEPKDFRFRTPYGAHGYTYASPPQKRPLYGLMGVLTANCLFITEGEKDSDSLNAIRDWPAGSIGRVYATTAGAAGSWTPEHAMYTAGKRVVVFEDNDAKGRESALTIVHSCYPVAQSVRLVRFEEMPEKSDVTDFLETHGFAALLEKIKNAPVWAPPKEAQEESVIVEGIAWAGSESVDVRWLVDGVIQREGNGIIMGDPKASKSLLSVHLISHLITGTPWFGHAIPERVKVGLVTREDAPGLTKSRIRRFIRGENLSNLSTIDGWLWVNSREQTKTFDILDDAEFNRLVRQFKTKGCGIVFFDVFNRCHTLNENDNQEMSRVTAKLSQFGDEVGCQVALVHHLNKGDGPNIFNRLRGAGALHGWMEWGLAVTLENPNDPSDQRVRKVAFESKETAIEDLRYIIEGGSGDGYLRLVAVEESPAAAQAPRGYRAPRPAKEAA